MKLNRKSVTLGLVALALVGALAGGGVALAASTGTTAPRSTATGSGHCGGMYGMSFGTNSPMAAVAGYLGLSQTELRERMQAGKSLADLAKAQGKSVAGLKAAMVAAMKRNLDPNPSLTAEQKADILANMKAHIDAMLTTTDMFGGRMGSHMGGMWN
jgi:hypothetical protein